MAEDPTQHVAIRDLAFLAGDADQPRMPFAVETRDRPGPAYKNGVWSDDIVWIQLKGGLFVAKAEVRIAWSGEYGPGTARVEQEAGAPMPDAFWAGRPKYGYAMVAQLHKLRWIDPFWGGPRTYGYEWVVLEDEKKRASWLEPKAPPRGGEGLLADFQAARDRGFPPAGG